MGPPRSGEGAQKKVAATSGSSLPGVQKIKSSLRQTRRLLAKDTLPADVRVETERRLKSLQADLTKAEQTRKERNMAVKYHKVKFFERQKICRKIRRTKKELENPEMSADMLASLHETLLSYRVDLNYILHYPKTKRYISLFPPNSSKPADGIGNSDTDRQREELRQHMREAMRRGEMDAEPEMTLAKDCSRVEAIGWGEEESKPQQRIQGKGMQKDANTNKSKGVPGDDFFETSANNKEDDGG